MADKKDRVGSANDGFVRAIRSYASGLNLADKDLAKRIGIHPATMSNYLTENLAVRVRMHIDTVWRIAEALGIDGVKLAVLAQEWQSKVGGVTPPASGPAVQSDSKPAWSGPERRKDDPTRAEFDQMAYPGQSRGEDGSSGLE